LWETATSELVEGVLHWRLSPLRVAEAEAAWSPFRTARPSEHDHWDWGRKVWDLSEPGVRVVGVECRGDVQGMMKLLEAKYYTRVVIGRATPLLYVDFLESAPWNNSSPSRKARFKGVGLLLMQVAVELSHELGYNGRVGLHSLPQFEGFYSSACGMCNWGSDANYDGLTYFETQGDRTLP
jgi:hypothetical protein